MSTDEDDWHAACSGGAAQFAAVYDRHVADVRRAAARFTDSPAEAEDVMAVVFLTLWERRRTVRFVNKSLRPWLLVTSTDGEGPGAAVDAARALPLAEQRVVVLCVLYGYSVRDAATVLGIAEGTVKSRLHRARRRMGAAITVSEGTAGAELH
jgi:DNA-directed RNA polymerase specialized sigma24 family protein